MANSEKLDFDVDKAILVSIMQAQAGSLPKALLEGVMNAIDGGAKSLAIKLSATEFVLNDDGRGFENREQIEKWFKTFGTKHEEGDAVYGKYRMGRGQLFSFAENTWRTGTFEMHVDIQNKGMGFVLKTGLGRVKGCRITGKLYQPLSVADLADVVREFSSFVKFAQIPVRLNGKLISKKPADMKWDIETPEAYIKVVRDQPLEVYNLGVLVKSYENWAYGCGGTIVSKQALQVNFARNDILTSKCEVWRKISSYMKATNLVKVATKPSLNKDERQFLARQCGYGNLRGTAVDAGSLKLITDITGRHHSISDVLSKQRISFASDKQSRTGAQLHRQGAAFVVAQETLNRFGASDLDELLATLRHGTEITQSPACLTFEELAMGFSENYSVLSPEALPLEEQLMVQVLNTYHGRFYEWFRGVEKSNGFRELRVGESNVARAWTDGKSYIVTDVAEFRKAAKRGAPGFMDLLTLLLHEYVHDEADLESHDHDMHFYNKFHDLLVYGGAMKLHGLAVEMDKALQALRLKHGLTKDKGDAASASSMSRVSTPGELLKSEFNARQMALL